MHRNDILIHYIILHMQEMFVHQQNVELYKKVKHLDEQANGMESHRKVPN